MAGTAFYETMNLNKLSYIIDNFENLKPFLRASCFGDSKYDPLTALRNIRNACDKNGRLTVIYHQKNDKGRCMADMSLSFQSMIREVRHTLAKDIYIDIDMVNAHPCILSYLAKKNNLTCDYLDMYINNRDEYLKPFASRDEGKQIYLAGTNGGHADFDNLKKEQKTPHLIGYYAEMKILHNAFSSMKKYKEEFKTYCKSKTERRNFKAGFMNTLLCEMENNILDVVINYLAPNCRELVKCFDGVMLLNNKKYDIKGCEEAINKVYKGINIKLSVKPFDQGIIIPDTIPKYIHNIDYIFSDIIQPSKKQLQLFNTLLNEITLNNMYDARKVIHCSKNWANCKKVLDIVTDVLNKNNIKDIDIRKVWNYENVPGVKPASIASLLRAHQNSTCEKKLRTKDYHFFKMCSHIEQLEGIEKIKNVDIIECNQQYVTKLVNKIAVPDLKNFDMHKLKNKIVMIKSHTGSGKTDMMKYIASQLTQHTFISIATRIILAEYHATDILKTNFYLDKSIKLSNPKVWSRYGDKTGMSCVIDSLVRIKIDPNNKYVLFLDETSSLFEYIINKDNLSKKRRNIFNILVYLINNCEYCFCLDADLNTHTVHFISEILDLYKNDLEISKNYFINVDTNNEVYNNDYDDDDFYNFGITKPIIKTPIKKNIVLYHNKYKVNRCDINDFSSMPKIMRSLIDDIKNDVTLFICSDKNDYFYTEVFSKIIAFIKMEIKLKDVKTKNDKRLLTAIKNNVFAFYSADIGNKNDFKDSKQLSQKIVFVSPVLTTGVDLNYRAKVYGFYYGNHLTASTVVQQLGRIRKPSSINLYFSKGSYDYKYDNFEDLENDVIKARDEMRELLEYKRIDKTFDDIEGRYKRYSDFINEKLKSLRFHTLDILKNKGDNIKYINDDIDEFLKHIKIDKKDKTIDDETLKKRYAYICKPHIISKLDDTELELLNDICLNDNMFKSHINLRKILYDSEQDLMIEISKADDIECHQIESRSFKILLLKDLMKKMKIDINCVNYHDDLDNIKKSKSTYQMKSSYIETFKLSKHAYSNKLSKLDAHGLVLTMLKHLAPSFFASSARIKKKGKCQRFKIFDLETGLTQINTFNKKL